MPGRRLNDDERRLGQRWDSGRFAGKTLRSIEVSGGNGIRGVRQLIVPIRYPVAAICGKNGAGKSTVLSLSTLGYHSPLGWQVHWANTQPFRKSQDRTYYTFQDFFQRTVGEDQAQGTAVTWRYREGDSETSMTFTKGRGWGKYTTRPERPTAYLPLGRILPAQEVVAVRSTFSGTVSDPTDEHLDADLLVELSFVLGKKYRTAGVQHSKRYYLQRCESEASYTAFNMGAGESCVIDMLRLFQRIPRGGLLTIEEVEAGLHPQAQKRLAKALVRLSLSKDIQVICTTHSDTFLDALPRRARIVLRREQDEHAAINSPSTRFCVYEMAGEAQPELVVYCEDEAAAVLLEEAIPATSIIRTKISSVGSDATVIRQGVAHIRGGFPSAILCVLDGDATDQDIERWLNSETGGNDALRPTVLRLPADGLTPERWLIAQLEHQDYRLLLAQQLGCSEPAAGEHVAAMKVHPEHHSIAYVLHQRTNLRTDDCLRRVMRAVAPRHPQLDAIRTAVANELA